MVRNMCEHWDSMCEHWDSMCENMFYTKYNIRFNFYLYTLKISKMATIWDSMCEEYSFIKHFIRAVTTSINVALLKFN